MSCDHRRGCCQRTQSTDAFSDEILLIGYYAQQDLQPCGTRPAVKGIEPFDGAFREVVLPKNELCRQQPHERLRSTSLGIRIQLPRNLQCRCRLIVA